MRADSRNRAQGAVFEPERAGEWHVDALAGPLHFPGVAFVQPVVRLLDLIAFLDLLPEDAVFVAQAVANRGNVQRGERIEEAGGQSSESTVPETGIRLALDHRLP